MLSVVLPSTAIAAPSVGDSQSFTQNKANTDIYLQVDDESAKNLSATVPLKVVLAVNANGNITGPTNYGITNTSAFPIHVSDIVATAAEGYKFSNVKDENTMDISLTSGTDKMDIVSGDNLIKSSSWDINPTKTDQIAFEGSVGNITHDITNESQAFTLAFNITAGNFTNN